jgi:hypothetical protein
MSQDFIKILRRRKSLGLHYMAEMDPALGILGRFVKFIREIFLKLGRVAKVGLAFSL